MRKNIAFFLGILIFFSFLVFGNHTGAITINNPLSYNTFGELMNAIIDFIFNIALVVAPMIIIIAGFYFVTAAGDIDKIQRAKDMIWWTVIGFIIILLAKGLIHVLEEVIGIKIGG